MKYLPSAQKQVILIFHIICDFFLKGAIKPKRPFSEIIEFEILVQKNKKLLKLKTTLPLKRDCSSTSTSKPKFNCSNCSNCSNIFGINRGKAEGGGR